MITASCFTRIMGCEDGRGAGSNFAMGLSPYSYLGLPRAFYDVIGTTDDKGRWLFGRQLFNSLFVSGVTAFFGLALSATAAYALPRWTFPGKDRTISASLVTQMFRVSSC